MKSIYKYSSCVLKDNVKYYNIDFIKTKIVVTSDTSDCSCVWPIK